MNEFRTLTVAGAPALVALAGVLCASPVLAESVDETRPAATDARIEFRGVTGDFEIVGHDREELQISGTLGDDVEELVIEGDRNAWKVELKMPDHQRGRRGDGSELTIRVPSGSRLEARAVSADFTLADLAGESVDVETVSGDVDLTGVRPDRLQVKTVSGDVEGDAGGTDETRASTVSGDLKFRNLHARLQVKSVSGDISIEASEVTDVSGEAVSGDLDFRLRPAERARIEVNSHSGDLALGLPAGTALRIDAATFSGSIESELGGEIRSGRGPGQRLSLDSGAADVEIEARTFSGEIRFRHLD